MKKQEVISVAYIAWAGEILLGWSGGADLSVTLLLLSDKS